MNLFQRVLTFLVIALLKGVWLFAIPATTLVLLIGLAGEMEDGTRLLVQWMFDRNIPEGAIAGTVFSAFAAWIRGPVAGGLRRLRCATREGHLARGLKATAGLSNPRPVDG